MIRPDFLKLAFQVFASGIVFVVICGLIFWPLEELLDGEKSTRPKFKDIAYLWFYQSYGLWIGAGVLYELAYLLRGLMPKSWSSFATHQPFWLQAVIALLMAEVWVYSAHRLAHQWPFLWKFHRVHHTLVDMTWSAASRQHPVDFFITIVGANLPAMILGIDLRSIALFVLLERLYTVMLHSNLNLDWGWFSKVMSSPKVHRLHHSPTCQGKNYAGLLSLLDVIGKTYQSPVSAPTPEASVERQRDSAA